MIIHISIIIKKGNPRTMVPEVVMNMNMNMMSVLVAVAAGALGLVLLSGALKWVHKWFWVRGLSKEKRRRLPPGDMGFPFIGSMWDFIKAYKFYGNPGSFMDSLDNRNNHVGIYKAVMFGSPTAMLTTPETIKQVLMDDEHFIPGWPKATNELIGKKSFLFKFNEEHKMLRKITSSSVNGFETLSTYLTFIEEVVVSTLDEWSKMDQILFLNEMRRTTFRIIMHIFFSSASKTVMEAVESAYADLNLGVRAMAINLPGFAFHKAMKARRKLIGILQPIVDERRATKHKNQGSKRKDLMDNLLNVKYEDGKGLTDEEIIDLLIMYLNAGHESSAHMTMWTMILLEQNPEVLKKAKEEQEEVRKNIPSTQKGLTLREIRKMEYLSKVIDESLRMVSLSFVNFREAVKDVEVNGYLVPKGWKLALWYRSVHMNPEVYPQAEKFDPSRWDKIPKSGTFLPFGGGSRLCPGNDLAKLEISVFLHYFLLNYKLIRLNPDCPLMYLPHMRPMDNCPARIIKISETSN